jgi:hypothetical protein
MLVWPVVPQHMGSKHQQPNICMVLPKHCTCEQLSPGIPYTRSHVCMDVAVQQALLKAST